MARHLFKVPLPTSDMFIYSVSLKKKEIGYEVRDPEGKLLETPGVAKITTDATKAYFDSRFIPIDLIKHIETVLS